MCFSRKDSRRNAGQSLGFTQPRTAREEASLLSIPGDLTPRCSLPGNSREFSGGKTGPQGTL